MWRLLRRRTGRGIFPPCYGPRIVYSRPSRELGFSRNATGRTVHASITHWYSFTVLRVRASRRIMLGIAERAYQRGFNVLRMNQRNCGGTEHLTPTLCHSGLSADYRKLLSALM